MFCSNNMLDYKRQVLYFEKQWTTLEDKGLLPSLDLQVFSTDPLDAHSAKLSTSSDPNPVCKVSNSIFPLLSRISFTSSSSTASCEARVLERQTARRGVHPGDGNSSSRRLSWFSREPEARESTRKDSKRFVGWWSAKFPRRCVACRWSKLRRFLPVMKVTTWKWCKCKCKCKCKWWKWQPGGGASRWVPRVLGGGICCKEIFWQEIFDEEYFVKRYLTRNIWRGIFQQAFSGVSQVMGGGRQSSIH